MANTTNLQLPIMSAAQAQKHVTYNEAIRKLDVLVQARVISIGDTTPPVSPADGDTYIPGSGATGVWDDWDFNIAYYVDGAWIKIVPKQGWQVFDVDDDTLYRYDTVAFWQPVATASPAAEDVTFTPGGGIAATNVQDAIEELDTEKSPKANPTFTGTVTLAADPTLALQAATKQYVDAIIAAQDAMVFKGVIDCSANPNYPAADRGWTYRVSVAGKIGGGAGPNVEVGDLLMCLTDGTASGNHATVGTNWSIAQTNLDGAVIGPPSVTDSRPALFDGTSGKLLKQHGAVLGDAAAKNTGTSAGTVAAGDDSRITGAIQSSLLTTRGDLIRRGASAPERVALGASGTVVSSDGTDAVWRAAPYPPGHLVGLTLSINVTDAANDIDIAIGSARDSTDVDNMVLGSALTKRCDAAWAVGTNQGGVDSGSGGNGWWYFWLIKRSDTGVVDALLSASATAPTMPTNYDRKRRIGVIVRTGGATLAFVQDGDRFRWKTPIGDISATNPGTAAVSRTLSVPPGIRVLADISVGFATTGNPANNPGAVYISDLSQADAAASQLNAVSLMSYNAESAVMVPMSVMTTSGQVRSRLQISAAGTVLYITTHGWIDTRDRV